MQKNDILCFVHIEKAAGTTLKHIFRRMFFLRHLTVRPYFKQENYKQTPYSAIFSAKDLQLVLHLNPLIKIISGHSVKPYADLEQTGKRLRYITILRDPINRYISHYEHSLRLTKKTWTFEEFMNIEEHNNFQTRKIAGVVNIDKAKNCLESKFDVVGIVEQFDSFLALLALKYDFGKTIWKYEIRNKGKKSDLIDEMRSKYREKIISINQIDIQLYNYVLSTIIKKNNEELKKYLLVQNETKEIANLSFIDRWKIKLDYYFESFYFDPITNMIRRINGLKPKGCYY